MCLRIVVLPSQYSHKSLVDPHTVCCLCLALPCLILPCLVPTRTGANLNAQSHSGSTPLALAVFHCDPRLVEIILRRPDVVLDQRHAQGNTEAMMAAFCGDVDILTLLLDAGASATVANDVGHTVETILMHNHNLTVDEAREKARRLRAGGGTSDGFYSDFLEAAHEVGMECQCLSVCLSVYLCFEWILGFEFVGLYSRWLSCTTTARDNSAIQSGKSNANANANALGWVGLDWIWLVIVFQHCLGTN